MVSNFERSAIEFFGVSGALTERSPHPQFTMIANGQHHMVTGAQWDPTGRFFVTVTSSLEQQMDNGIRVWNVNGILILQEKMTRLSHVAWRPLARTVLSSEEVAKIRQELPETSRRYVAEALEEQQKTESATTKRKTELEGKYKKTMDAIQAHSVEHEWAVTRLEEIARAPAHKHAQKLLAELAAAAAA